jgi:hypothetical protein
MSNLPSPASPMNAPTIPSDGGIIQLFRPENLARSQHPAIVSLTANDVTSVSASIIAEVGGPRTR